MEGFYCGGLVQCQCRFVVFILLIPVLQQLVNNYLIVS